MRSDVLVVAEPGRLPRIECRGGLAARLTGPDTVHLVSAAATPLGGDVIAIRLIVNPGTRLALRTVAATIALPGRETAESVADWDVQVGGELDLDPQPTVVAANARHLTDFRIQLAEGSRVRLRERVQIGRTNERDGFWAGATRVEVDGRPLLRHRVELGRGSVTDDVLGRPMAYISELRFPEPALDVPGTTLALAGGGSLSTWQGDRLYS